LCHGFLFSLFKVGCAGKLGDSRFERLLQQWDA
jgi:hypothetical protein